jgi:hypothetical protein
MACDEPFVLRSLFRQASCNARASLEADCNLALGRLPNLHERLVERVWLKRSFVANGVSLSIVRSRAQIFQKRDPFWAAPDKPAPQRGTESFRRSPLALSPHNRRTRSRLC